MGRWLVNFTKDGRTQRGAFWPLNLRRIDIGDSHETEDALSSETVDALSSETEDALIAGIPDLTSLILYSTSLILYLTSLNISDTLLNITDIT